MGTIKELRFWTYKILPLVYDDSLSYIEVLSKVKYKLNEVIKTTNELPDAISAEIKKQLQGDGDIYKNLFSGILNAIATDEGDDTYTPNVKQGGEVIWLNGTLYEVVQPMAVGVNYIVGNNIVPISVDTMYQNIIDTISAHNEYWHERAVSKHDTATYMWWKGELYRVDNDIAVNDILSERNTVDGTTTGQLSPVNIMDEITAHYLEMHEADNNLQTQIDENDGDIENLNKKDTDLQNQINNNNDSVNSRINNIVSQAGNDNTEIVDARKVSTKYGNTVLSTLASAIYYQINRSLGSIGYISKPDEVFSANLDLLEQPINTILQVGSKLKNGPFDQPYTSICIKYDVSDGNDFKCFLAFKPYYGIALGLTQGTTISWSYPISSKGLQRGLQSSNVNISDNATAINVLGEEKNLLNLPLNRVYVVNGNLGIVNSPFTDTFFSIISYSFNANNEYVTYIAKSSGSTKIGYRTTGNIVWQTLVDTNINKRNVKSSNTYISTSQDAINVLGEPANFANLPKNTIYQSSAGVNALNKPFTSGVFNIVALSYTIDNEVWSLFIASDLLGTIKTAYIRDQKQSLHWKTFTMQEDIIANSYASYKIFHKVGCIGDSYTAGYMSDLTPTAPHYEYSWPHYMSVDSGNTYENFGVSGATAKSWLTSPGHTSAMANKCPCYLIGLGINDENTKVEIGTIDDCGTDNDTFYANYYKIIAFCHDLVPDSILFVMTNPNVAPNDTYNEAIKAIAEKYKTEMNCHCLDLYQYNDVYTKGLVQNYIRGGHPSAIGYANMASILEKIWSNYIDSNPSFFNKVPSISF